MGGAREGEIPRWTRAGSDATMDTTLDRSDHVPRLDLGFSFLDIFFFDGLRDYGLSWNETHDTKRAKRASGIFGERGEGMFD